LLLTSKLDRTNVQSPSSPFPHSKSQASIVAHTQLLSSLIFLENSLKVQSKSKLCLASYLSHLPSLRPVFESLTAVAFQAIKSPPSFTFG
jgi:hypothetical protein